MDRKLHIPKSWSKALENKAKITDDDIRLFGKGNLSNLIFNLQNSLSKLSKKRNRKPAVNITGFIQELKEIQKTAKSAPLFPMYRNNNYIKEDEILYLYVRSNFFPVIGQFKNNIQGEIMINSVAVKLEYMERFVSIKSGNILSSSDFEFLKNNTDFARIWLSVAHCNESNFDIDNAITALSVS